MRILGIDFESAGTRQSGIFRPVEVGAAIYNTSNARLELSFGYLLNDLRVAIGDKTVSDLENHYKIPEEVTAIHGISTEEVLKRGRPISFFISDLVNLNIYDIDAIMVWNGYFFDRDMLFDIFSRRFDIPADFVSRLEEIPWIDLKLDGGYKYRLDHEAGDRGILSAYPHMGLADVITMFRVLTHDLKEKKQDIFSLLEKARTPFVIVLANTQFHEKDKTKAAGFRWSPGRRKWAKLLRSEDLNKECLGWDFAFEHVLAEPALYQEIFFGK